MLSSCKNLIVLVIIILLSFYVKAEKQLSLGEAIHFLTHQHTIRIDGIYGTPIELIVQKQEQYHKHDQPLFSWNFFWTINENNRTRIITFNKKNKDIIEKEKKMQKILEPYDSWLGNRYELILKLRENSPTDSSKSSKMLNGMGGASKQYCSLTDYNFIPYLLTYMPPKGNRVVVDAGSGWGACSKQLALLGYKVYSIDIDGSHIDFQKKDFCNAPDEHTFIYNYWKIYNPRLISEPEYFQQYCQNSQKNIEYIVGDFSKEKVINKIPNNNIDIILAIDSIQFIESENQRFKTFQLLDTLLKKGGIFFIQSPTQYEHKYNFDLAQEILSNQFFRKYKVITASSLYKTNSNQIANKLHHLSLQKR